MNENKGLGISLIAKSSGEKWYTTKKINVCKTVGGRRKLISKLSNHSGNNKYINDSQELILELSNNINFLVDFQVNLNNKVDSSIDFNEGLSYLNKKKFEIKLSSEFLSLLDNIDNWLFDS